MRKNSSRFFLICALLLLPISTFAATINYDASSLTQKATIFVSPRSGSFIEGSTFEVPIFIDTKNKGINTIELHISYNPRVAHIVSPSNGKSIIGIWLTPPTYSNTNGTVTLIGSIPDGVVTSSGLLTTLTFKGVSSGQLPITITPESKVYAHDGNGTEVETSFQNATYAILPKPPEGIKVISETHPDTNVWYNNNNPVLTWEKDSKITDFSYELDTTPTTIPDNTPESKDFVKAYENLPDGLHYFHIKARKGSVWGSTTHFFIRIDTTAPAAFTVTDEYLKNKALVTFFTTDALSGIDHYEIGTLDKNSNSGSPLFVEAQSPFQIPLQTESELRTIIRAYDRAGNVRETSIDLSLPPASATLVELVKQYALIIVSTILGLVILGMFLHYFLGHHVARRLKHAWALFKKEEELEHQQGPTNFTP